MILIADNLQGTHPAVIRSLEGYNPEPVQDLARSCELAGAQALDINPGHLARDAEEKMAFLVESVQSATDLPLVLDTADPAALAAGLKACRHRPIINGFSLEPRKLDTILPLAWQWDVDIIGYLLTPEGQVPLDAAGRLEAAMALYEAFGAAGMADEHLIIDPVVVPVWWQEGNRQARDVLDVIGTLPQLLGFEVSTVVGLSNLANSAPSRDNRLSLEAAYLPMLAAAGLTHVLLNVTHGGTVRLAKACRLLLTPGVFAWGTLD